MYELGRDEADHRARAKIDSLKLTEDEWKQVENFIDLLKVSLKPLVCVLCFLLTLFSMPTNHSKHSHMKTDPVFMQEFWHLNLCTKRGAPEQHALNMHPLWMDCVLVRLRLRSTIIRRRHHMRTLL